MGITFCEKYQSVFIRSDLKWVDQDNYATSKANRALGMFRKLLSAEILSYGRSCKHRLLDRI